MGVLLRVPQNTISHLFSAYNSVNFLITWGAELNKQDTDTGVSALHLATMSGNALIVRKLLVKGIDRNLKDFLKKTALDFAKEND